MEERLCAIFVSNGEADYYEKLGRSFERYYGDEASEHLNEIEGASVEKLGELRDVLKKDATRKCQASVPYAICDCLRIDAALQRLIRCHKTK
jgi:hypothetical protein